MAGRYLVPTASRLPFDLCALTTINAFTAQLLMQRPGGELGVHGFPWGPHDNAVRLSFDNTCPTNITSARRLGSAEASW